MVTSSTSIRRYSKPGSSRADAAESAAGVIMVFATSLQPYTPELG